MEPNHSALLLKYPAIISADQFRQICHISKRKATWLLENGYVPCRDSGKKIRRFQIKLTDVIDYMHLLETAPDKITPPVGIFNSKHPEYLNNHCATKTSSVASTLRKAWIKAPDALTPRDVAHLTGRSVQSVSRWIHSGQLDAVQCPDGILVAKAWLITFWSEYICKNHVQDSLDLDDI